MIRAVGVVVPAHNEQDLLPLCLASLHRASQALRSTEVHLVVVADACSDLTAQVARGYGASVVTITARNVGAARAGGVREVLRGTRHPDPAGIWLVGTIRVADWSGYQPAMPALFGEHYNGGTGPHSHVHGANLGFRASAYLAVGGFPAKPTAEDHALVSALTACGSRVLRTRALPVVTSAQRESRAPHGFSQYLAQLDTATA